MTYSKKWIRKNYQLYLQSRHWRDIRARYYKSGRPKECYVCGSKEQLHLHHRTYKRVGRERLKDLILLCKDCHGDLHDWLEVRFGNKYKHLYNAHVKMRKRRGRKQEPLQGGVVARCGRSVSNSGNPFTETTVKAHEKSCAKCQELPTGNLDKDPRGYVKPEMTEDQESILEQLKAAYREKRVQLDK